MNLSEYIPFLKLSNADKLEKMYAKRTTIEREMKNLRDGGQPLSSKLRRKYRSTLSRIMNLETKLNITTKWQH